MRATLVPNDGRYFLQAGTQRVGAEASWDHVARLAAGSSMRVTVCVIDTGIDYNHTELRPNIHPLVGYNALDGSADPWDDSSTGHGTHCAGTIGAAQDDRGGTCGALLGSAGLVAELPCLPSWQHACANALQVRWATMAWVWRASTGQWTCWRANFWTPTAWAT